MGMNIKNPETKRLARELAKLTGESMTAAVTVALSERLERIRCQEKPGDLAAKLRAIAEETGPLWKEPWKSMDIGDYLHDEMDLPE